MTLFFARCSFSGICLGRVSWFGLTQQWNHLQQTDRNRQKAGHRTVPRFNPGCLAFKSENRFAVLLHRCGCYHSFPFSNAGHATFNLCNCDCEMPGRVPNWRNQFTELLGILNLAKTLFEQCILNNFAKLHHDLLWHQLFQKGIFEHFINIIFGKQFDTSFQCSKPGWYRKHES